jgi:hypothetical protein
MAVAVRALLDEDAAARAGGSGEAKAASPPDRHAADTSFDHLTGPLAGDEAPTTPPAVLCLYGCASWGPRQLDGEVRTRGDIRLAPQ